MDKEESEKWIGAIRRKMEMHTEVPPGDIWERIERDAALTANRKSRMRTLRRRWLACAACVAAIIGVTALLRLGTTVTPTDQKTLARIATNDRQETVKKATNEKIAEKKIDTDEQSTQNQPTHNNKTEQIACLSTVPQAETETTNTKDAQKKIDTEKENNSKPITHQTSTKQNVDERSTQQQKVSAPAKSSAQTYQEQLLSLPAERHHSHWSMLVAVSSHVNNTNNGNGVGANYAYDAVDGLTNNIINSSFIFMGGADANDMEMGQSRIKLRHRMPLKFSVLGEKMIVGNWLSVQTGLSLTYLYSEPADKNLGSGFNQRVYYLGLPVKLNYHFYTNRNFTAYVGAGAEIQKCIYAKRAGEKVTISNPQFGINASIGAQYNLAQHVALFVEPGISRYWGNKDKIETYVTENPVSFDFHAGLKLTY